MMPNAPVSIHSYQSMFAASLALQTDELARAIDTTKKILLELRALSTVPIEIQDKIRLIKVSVSNQVVKASAYHQMYQDLASHDRNLALMNLTMLNENPLLYM